MAYMKDSSGRRLDSFNVQAADAMPGTLGRKAVAVGDSIMAASTISPYAQDPLSWFTSMCWLSGGKLILHRNASRTGQTSDVHLANFDADTAGADVVFIMPSTNDVGVVPVPWATSLANITEMIRRCRIRGQEPILCLTTPRVEDAQFRGKQIRQRNVQWIKFAQDNRVRLVDTYTPFLDSATGNPKAAFNTDGLHPNLAGAFAIAQSVLTQLSSFLAAGPSRIPLPNTNLVSPNLLTGGIFATDNGSGKATGWNLFGVGTGSFTTDAAIPGRIWHIDSTSGYELSQAVPVGGGTPVVNVGDTVQVVGKIKTTATTSNVQFQFGAKQVGLTGKDYLASRLITGLTTPDWFTFSLTFVVEPGCTSILASVNQVVSSQTSACDLAQWAVYNLSTQPA